MKIAVAHATLSDTSLAEKHTKKTAYAEYT
jgi:hypothetical protein